MDHVYSIEFNLGLDEAAIKMIDRASILGLRLVSRGEVAQAPEMGLPSMRLLGFFSDTLCARLQRECLALVTLFPATVLLTAIGERRTRISARAPPVASSDEVESVVSSELSSTLRELVLGPFTPC